MTSWYTHTQQNNEYVILVHIFLLCVAYYISEIIFHQEMHCYKYKNISCALYVAACNILLTMISHDFANYSTNITLLINWHITSGLNRIYIVPYWLIYQLFLTDDVPCCAPLLSHCDCQLSSLAYACMHIYRFLQHTHCSDCWLILAQWVDCNVIVCTWLYVTWS